MGFWINNAFVAALCLIAQAPLSGEVRAAGSPIEIYAENAAEPFSKPDGTGYANDVVLAAFAAVGVPIKLVVVPYARCKSQVISGTGAACFSMSWDPSFAGKIKFADTPLITTTPVYFESASRPLLARNEGELGKGVTIGIVRGYEYPVSALQVKARGAVFEETTSEQLNLKKLAAGRIDAALVMTNPLTSVDYWAKDAGVATQVRIAFKSATSDSGYFAVSTQHPDGLPLLAQYNAGIKIITANGKVAQLRAKWTEAK